MIAILWTVWAVLYAGFWVLGIRAGWAWRKTYVASASRHAAHAVIMGYGAMLAGVTALVFG